MLSSNVTGGYYNGIGVYGDVTVYMALRLLGSEVSLEQSDIIVSTA